MEYFLEFHWWYIAVILLLHFIFFAKGGVVIDEFVAQLEPLDERFKNCEGYCNRRFFKNGKDEKFTVDIQHIDLPVGEEVTLLLNQKVFKKLKMQKRQRIEFDIWNSDESFPLIQIGDKVEIHYQGQPIFEGVFKETAEI